MIVAPPLHRNRGFALLWFGQLTSEFGSGLLQLAVLLHVYASTRSTLATTAAFVAERVPGALLSPWSGALADRVNRRTLLLLADVFRALLLLPLLVDTELAVLLAVLAAQAAVGSVFHPAYGAYVPSVVPRQQLASANAFFAGTGAGLSLLAPAAGAALYAQFGFSVIVLVDIATFFVSVATLLCLPDHPTARRDGPRTSMRDELSVAVWVIRSTPLLRLLFVTAMCFAMVEALLGPLFVPFLQGTLHASAPAVGFAASAQSIGTVVGGLVVAALARRIGATRMFVLGCVGAAIAVSVVSLAPSYPVAVVAIAVMGVPSLFSNIGSMTLLQTNVPDELRGRVLGGFYALFGATALIGTAVPAFASGLVGVRSVVVVGAGFAILAAVLAVSGYRSLLLDDA